MLKSFELFELILAGALFMAGMIVYLFTGRYFSSRLPTETSASHAPRGKPIQKGEFLFLLLALGLGFLLDLRALTRSFNYDELYSAYYFFDVDSFWTVVSTYRIFNNHIGYSVLAWLAQKVLGKDEWVFRLPALLLGLGTILSGWFFSRRLFGAKIAGLASLLLAISPVLVFYSKSARGYTGLVFFTLISSHLFLKLLDAPRKRDGIIFIVASVLGIYFHLYAVWVIAVQFLYLVLLSFSRFYSQSPDQGLSRKSFLYLWISYPLIFILALILYLPVLDEFLSSMAARSDGVFVPQFPLGIIQFFGGTKSPADLLFAFIVFIGVAFAWRRSRREAGYMVLALIIPLFIIWVIIRPFDLYPRFFIYFIPYYLTFQVLGFVYLLDIVNQWFRGRGLLLFQGLVAALIFSVTLIWMTESWNRTPNYPYREAVQELAGESGSGASLCIIGVRAPILQFYSEEPLIYPRTFAQFEELANENRELRCAVFESRGNSEDQNKMSEFLMKNAVHLGEYRTIDLFLYSE